PAVTVTAVMAAGTAGGVAATPTAAAAANPDHMVVRDRRRLGGAVLFGVLLRILRGFLEGTVPDAVGRLGPGDRAITRISLQVGVQVGIGQVALVPERLHTTGPIADDDALAAGHLKIAGGALAGLGRG